MLSFEDIFIFSYTLFLFLIFLGLLIISIYKERENIIIDKNYRPKALIIMPIKGIDLTLEDNLVSIKEQDYDNYDLIAVVDSEEDPCIKILDKLKIKYIISDKGGKGSGKVKAIATALKTFENYDVYVLIDSDVRVSKNWLKKMIEALSNKEIGLVTAFPIFKPLNGFWSKVKSVWGLVGLRMMESRYTRFGWGGSLSFRKDLIDKEFLEYFKNCLSDDIALTSRCKRIGLKIHFVRDASIKVYCKEDFHSFIEWSNRQTALSILGNSKVFSYGLIYYLLNNLLFLSSIILSFLISLFYILFMIPIIINAIKNAIKLKNNNLTIFLISLIINFIYTYNLIKAKTMKYIIWRGNKYILRQYQI